ncbi:MAG TPA: phosphoglucomutase/phosphomannomutase family protein [Thermoanaerobaculia bacterium]|nr:phosphoglucomutase/phosphomannomutase family protein [Thermoanaerobaculia bacterium]
MIKFGTSGWRGVIGEDFTFESVRIATQGIANYLKKSKVAGTGVIVAYDTRFLSEKFASEAAKVLAFNGIKAFLCTRDVPTPCVSFEIIRRRAMGAINFTASHNPPEYNGLKFSTSNGAPALPEITRQIETEVHAVQDRHERVDVYAREELIEEIDPKDRYLTELRQKIDMEAIRNSGLRIAIDSLYGTSRDYLDYFLLESGIEVKIIHNYRDPYFGGFSPECSEKNLGDLRRVVTEEKFDLGLATDGDADRFGIIDDRNRFVSPNTILALLAVYLKRFRNIPGGLARSVATTHLIDAIAKKLGVPLYETPVGFKYIGELILEDKIALGGEESAGVSMYRHLPEKDGVLACLLVAEMVARTGKRLPQLIEEMHEEFGYFYTRRADLKLTASLKESLAKKLADPPAQLDDLKVREVNTTDGVKLIFNDQTWLLFRLSGTEPVARLYAEACSPKDLKHVFDVGKKFVAPAAAAAAV